MPDTQLVGGLMQALGQIVKRQPIHIIISNGMDDALHVVIQPVWADDKETRRSPADPASKRRRPNSTPISPTIWRSSGPGADRLRSILDQVKNAAEPTARPQ